MSAAEAKDTAKKLSFVSRFLAREALAKARVNVDAIDPVLRTYAARARHALELADRLRKPVEPLLSGPSDDLAIGLYQQACYWALLANGATGSTLATAYKSIAPEQPETAQEPQTTEEQKKVDIDPDSAQFVESTLIALDLVQIAELTTSDCQKIARSSSKFVRGLLRRFHRPDDALRGLRCQTFLRLFAATLLLLILVLGGVLGLQFALRKHDLAKGKPFTTSSRYPNFDETTQTCDGHGTKILFHTQEDSSPWVQYDLLQIQPVTQVEVHNRVDCCSGRAVPLVVEVSPDGVAWSEVATKEFDFRSWTASFPPHPARYVRLTTRKRSWLHLEKVVIR